MASFMALQFLVATFLLAIPVTAAQYSVKPHSAVSSCPQAQDSCHTLSEYVAEPNKYFTSHSNFTFMGGEHYLNTSLNLTGVTGVTLRGSDTETTSVCVAAGGKIVWEDSQDITISHLRVVYEGATAMTSHTVLTFEGTISVLISNVEFIGVNEETVYSQALKMNRTNASIVDCHFDSWHSINGGAIYIAESILDFSGSINFTSNAADFSGGGIYANLDSTVIFNGTSTFFNNSARTFRLFMHETGGGGGLYASESNIELHGLSIFKFNGPITGNIELHGSSIYIADGTFLKIFNAAIFRNNTATNAGAIKSLSSKILLNGHFTFAYNSNGTVSLSNNTSLNCIGNVTFTKNRALTGAGMFVSESFVTFDGNVNFINNIASSTKGGALLGRSHSIIQFNKNTTFTENSAGMKGGAIYIESSNLICEGDFTLTGNSADYQGGGMYAADDSIVNVKGRVMFSKNSAVEGGGLVLEDNSQLVLNLPVIVNFDQNIATSMGGAIDQNNATSKGGAIFVEASDGDQCPEISITTSNCFFSVSSANTTEIMSIETNPGILFTFTQNLADTGLDLYGGFLEFCMVQFNGHQISLDSFLFFRKVSSFDPVDEGAMVPYITSDPLQVCFCNNEIPDCSNLSTVEVMRSRGQQFNLSVAAIGQGNVSVPSNIRALISPSSDTRLSPQSHDISSVCTNITFSVNTPKDVNQITLTLYPQGPCRNIDSSHSEADIILLPCPDGFEIVGDKCDCQETLKNLSDEVHCNIETKEIQRPENFWLEPIFNESGAYQGFSYFSKCPLNYCKPESAEISFPFMPNVSDKQCSSNRMGKLCGACRKNCSMTLYSYSCKECDNRYISLLLFFAFAGVALIVFLLALRMTVAAGTINGLILYANIVNANSFVFFPPDKADGSILTTILTVFISWLNLDFGIESCFYDGLNFYSYTWLNYIFPFYLWFLISIIIIISRVSMKVGVLFGSNPAAVLATVILLSYNKLLEANILALSSVSLEYSDGHKETVWFYDANITHFRGEHIILAIFVILVIVFLLLPYFFLLTLGYWLQSYSEKRAFFWINKFKPLLDAYYAPYRKKSRYWPGFMLLVRTCLFLSFTFHRLGNGSESLVAISSVFTVIALIPWLSNRIYEKFYNDILEASFILNICLLSIASYHVRLNSADVNKTQAILTYTSIGIAFLQFIGIVCFHLYLRLKDTKPFRRLATFVEDTRLVKLLNKGANKAKNRFQSSHQAVKMDDQQISSRPEVTVTNVDLREPLLESFH